MEGKTERKTWQEAARKEVEAEKRKKLALALAKAKVKKLTIKWN